MFIISMTKALIESIKELRITFAYWLTIATTLLLGYFTLGKIAALPKPETIIELIKFYFTHPTEYFGTTFLALVTGLFFFVLGLIGLVQGVDSEHDYSNILRITLIAIGLLLFGLSFYFLYYALLLVFVIVIIGLFAIYAFSNSNGRRYR
ncbi:hypothetical protein [Paenibacillus elgii]|uniref:hypothetical protein n=1 Tax=Paenibacillus elgii TaxID=189691 RepID=UPI00203E9B50|nr:hypothetical protein [Paenibacillus elgii]MCM3270862.1 hypothetical protein [Paenibacillus elgii]